MNDDDHHIPSAAELLGLTHVLEHAEDMKRKTPAKARRDRLETVIWDGAEIAEFFKTAQVEPWSPPSQRTATEVQIVERDRLRREQALAAQIASTTGIPASLIKDHGADWEDAAAAYRKVLIAQAQPAIQQLADMQRACGQQPMAPPPTTPEPAKPAEPVRRYGRKFG